MATYTRAPRRGLPRRPGGEPWPPAGAVSVDGVDSAPWTPAAVTVATSIRRGLPRVAGGEPWPPASVAPTSAPAPVATGAPVVAAEVAPVAAEGVAARVAPAAPTAAPATESAAAVANSGAGLRRGLPRVAGGDAWPPAGVGPAANAGKAAAPGPTAEAVAAPAVAEPIVVEPAIAEPVVVEVAAAMPVPAAFAASARVATATAPPATSAGPTPATQRASTGEKGFGRFTQRQWILGAALGSGWLIVLAALLVLGVRWFLDLDFMQDFLSTYPGEYHLPEGAPVGFPAWLAWQHFLNLFLLLMIIRSGLQVRTEKRPSAFWTPKNNTKGKISLTLWFHQSLDILWLVNGLVFVVLLFVTGQWMRIVPTSWEVFPNALSAALQYLSLDWPVENGWVNYNGLQQLAYFATVFIAAPLAAITGVRMSGLWPSRAKALTKAYPVEWARALHFPVMLYFVLFIFVHVMLVISTGALRNLNHMYGAQDGVNWTGFWIFAGSLIVIAVGWVAARPLVLAPIAGMMGKVSSR